MKLQLHGKCGLVPVNSFLEGILLTTEVASDANRGHQFCDGALADIAILLPLSRPDISLVP